MTLKDIVTTIETSTLLMKAGYNKKAIFSHFKNKEGHSYLGETDFSKDSFIAFAYTTSELTDSLPSKLDVDTNTFVVSLSNYISLTKEEVDNCDGAKLICFKTDVEPNAEYGVKYVVNNKMVAFGLTLQGEYRNLIFFSSSEAESRARMLLALIEEGKI